MAFTTWWITAHGGAILGCLLMFLVGTVMFVGTGSIEFPGRGTGSPFDEFEDIRRKMYLESKVSSAAFNASALGMLGLVFNAAYATSLFQLDKHLQFSGSSQQHFRRKIVVLGGSLLTTGLIFGNFFMAWSLAATDLARLSGLCGVVATAGVLMCISLLTDIAKLLFVDTKDERLLQFVQWQQEGDEEEGPGALDILGPQAAPYSDLESDDQSPVDRIS